MTAVALPRPARRIIAASALSNLSDGIRLAALPLLAASVSASPIAIASVFIVGQAPWLLLGLWAGALVDRSDPRRLARQTALVRTAVLVGLALLVRFGTAPIGLIMVAAFALGIGEVVADSTNGTLVPRLVPDHSLERANSRLIAAEITGNELVGPALGGLLFAVGASIPFFSNGALLAASLVLLAGLPLLAPTPTTNTTPPRAAEGVSLVRGSLMLRTLTWSSGILAAVDGAWFALLVLFVDTYLGIGPAGFGLLLAIGAVGGIAGSWLADRLGSTSLATISACVFATMSLSLFALAARPTVAMTAAALVLTSGAFALWNVFAVSARQRASAPESLGRVGATYRTAVVGLALVGTAAGAGLSEAASIRVALIAGGAILALAMPFVFRSTRQAELVHTG